ncbi:chemotaxis protein CheA [Oceanibium sediminis]|uniref:chemotaxis protein CheA n=1 Tax=Oceanibium sediminis TaxID=2026339 RepID=UPI000DD399C4|nr:chemotaxis protein CheA [Oceanibium sediminis]
MDDDEDFRSLFFSEARELLEQLQEHLNLLAEDAGDDETVHAAFRAVHSVKGGAAAFGFDVLIGFAHIFETVMDRIRSGTMQLDGSLAQTLLRSGDVMQILVENTESGSEDSVPGMARLQAELEALAGVEPSAAAEPAAGDDSPSADSDLDEDAVPEASEIIVRITPDESFAEAGHDMVRLIRSAREKGLSEVHVEGQVPPVTTFDPRQNPLTWELVFHTEGPVAALRSFFTIYEHAAQVEFLDSSDDYLEEDLDASDDSQAQDAPAGDAEPDTDPARGSLAAPNADASGESGSAQKRGEAAKSLRVEISRIDRLVNLVGEMLITQAALGQQTADIENREMADVALAVDTMSRQLRELQESVMAIRAQPVKSVFRRMPRVVRDLSEKLGKEARLELHGEHTEVDATVIEELTEPLTHMIRNAMDHGLESNDERDTLDKPRVGRIRLAAEHKGERVIITVEDDGRGVNRERVFAKALERGLVQPDDRLSPPEIDMLIFHPGFSTAQEVSSVSGRGVGMDVVKRKIQSLGGRFAMTSEPGKGTKFVITLPLTLAVMDGMTVSVADQKYILPLSTVVEALHVTRDNGRRLPDGTHLLERRGEYLKLLSLRHALDLPPREQGTEMAIVVDTETSGLIALTVDELIGQRQIVLKSLEANFKKINGISGATILGDGQVALILDIPALMNISPKTGAPAEVLH